MKYEHLQFKQLTSSLWIHNFVLCLKVPVNLSPKSDHLSNNLHKVLFVIIPNDSYFPTQIFKTFTTRKNHSDNIRRIQFFSHRNGTLSWYFLLAKYVYKFISKLIQFHFHSIVSENYFFLLVKLFKINFYYSLKSITFCFYYKDVVDSRKSIRHTYKFG